MITVSLCMIVKNEEDTIDKCLCSVGEIVDEIIIVDTGSEDRTREIASRFTDKIYGFEWIDDFSAARNFSFEQATMDYILWLDADDIILPGDAVKFKKMKETLSTDIDTVMMRYNTGFDTQGRAFFSCFRGRLSKTDRKFKWIEPVHEYLRVGGKQINSDICITHVKPYGRQSARNIRIYENFIAGGGELSPHGMYYYARELKDHGRYADAIKWFVTFLDSGSGWTEDNIAACGELARCHLGEGMTEKALSAMLRSFCYGAPRAETCCQIGGYFKGLSEYKTAVFWFELALNLDNNENDWGFRNEDCRGYAPCIELAACYYKLGEYSKAALFNERALEYKPDSLTAIINKRYFEGGHYNHSI